MLTSDLTSLVPPQFSPWLQVRKLAPFIFIHLHLLLHKQSIHTASMTSFFPFTNHPYFEESKQTLLFNIVNSCRDKVTGKQRTEPGLRCNLAITIDAYFHSPFITCSALCFVQHSVNEIVYQSQSDAVILLQNNKWIMNCIRAMMLSYGQLSQRSYVKISVQSYVKSEGKTCSMS